MEQVLMGMSGGVDSTYAALRLREMGYEVHGAVLKMHGYTEVAEATEAAKALDVPLTVLDCEERFFKCVVTDFIKEYCHGRTPNPCIVCNENVKFRVLYEEAIWRGIPHIATGHYANVVFEDGRFAVSRAVDPAKDQSYMLYRLPQDVLAMLLLPLGGITKSETTKEARRLRLRAAERAESQDICFVKGETYASYIERLCGKSTEGDFLDENGRILGRHKGILHYTVGQRKGLGISAAGRLFVKKIDAERNLIVLANKKVADREFVIESPIFSGICDPEALEKNENLMVQLRYTARPVGARVLREGEGLRVFLKEEAPFVTPGQSAVFYTGNKVAFGGIVTV